MHFYKFIIAWGGLFHQTVPAPPTKLITPNDIINKMLHFSQGFFFSVRLNPQAPLGNLYVQIALIVPVSSPLKRMQFIKKAPIECSHFLPMAIFMYRLLMISDG